MKLKTLYTASALLLVSGAASADPISISTPFGATSFFNALGATNLPVTSTYVNDGTISMGSEASDLVGASLAFTDMGVGTIGQLSPLLGTGTTASYGNDWVLDFTYTLTGVAEFIDGGAVGGLITDNTLDVDGNGVIDFVDAISPTYTGGTFEFFYRNVTTANTTKVLELDLNNFDVNGPNVVFNSVVNYDWYTAGSDALVENLFIDDSGYTFYELATAGGTITEAQDISFRTDFNIDPNLLPTCDDATCDTISRTTDINLSGVFAVPEPTSIAILGLGLLGLGLRRKTKA
ncbi:PEP-CTERM sorting domain-containing protein [Colwellia sp. 6_MG-2023]|uniref:PEP-CTERM sorting domain-containing protein n=1 Tax=Colwellia sp. 6_MG-2023 TaxID=3062676 RepID=UPI0026E2C0AC|nr:PEP-CTERM sorting domain-containing protein [Colwellia sp. 6_MG-2023]MDO6487694.1 PEP-CTERM sorting domain-containing protein [Colwellia sp. 6_MG-2023]